MSSLLNLYTFFMLPSPLIQERKRLVFSFFSLFSLSLYPCRGKKMKGGKLTKLKSVLKNWPSFTTRNSNVDNGRRTRISSVTVPDSNDEPVASSAAENLQAVYVGRCRRQYFVTSEVINHPLFQVLADKSELGSGGGGGGNGIIWVACEVVMFDHLLWMLENTDSSTQLDPNSMDELVQFYSTCST